jgi:ClpP class serine protease
MHHAAGVHFWDLLWIFFILSSLQPLVQKQALALSRRRTLASITSKRDATVITLIHRQKTISLLGIPLARHIDIDDSESVLRAIRGTAAGRTIENPGPFRVSRPQQK